MTYTITLKGLIFNTKIKNCKQHYFGIATEKIGPDGIIKKYKDITDSIMIIVLKNEERVFVNLMKYRQVIIPKEVHFVNVQKANEEKDGS
jgi:hypothetical protein